MVFPAWRAHLPLSLKQIQTAMLEMTHLSWWRSFTSFPNSYPPNPPILRSPLPPIPYPAVPGHPHTDTPKPVHLEPLRCHIVLLVIPTFPSCSFLKEKIAYFFSESLFTTQILGYFILALAVQPLAMHSTTANLRKKLPNIRLRSFIQFILHFLGWFLEKTDMQESNECSKRISIKQSNSVTSATNRHYFTLRLNGLQEELSIVYVNETASKNSKNR